jgi:hypothetical protein
VREPAFIAAQGKYPVPVEYRDFPDELVDVFVVMPATARIRHDCSANVAGDRHQVLDSAESVFGKFMDKCLQRHTAISCDLRALYEQGPATVGRYHHPVVAVVGTQKVRPTSDYPQRFVTVQAGLNARHELIDVCWNHQLPSSSANAQGAP